MSYVSDVNIWRIDVSTFDPDDKRRAHQALKDSVQGGRLRSTATNRFNSSKGRRDDEHDLDFERARPKFLKREDIEKGAEYDAGQVLKLTYGNQGRAVVILTAEDLKAFQNNIELLQSQYKRGITAKQVIDSSHEQDLSKANKEIHMAVPLSIKNGVVHFLTNAGPDSDVLNHHVHVEFLAFEGLKSSTGYTQAQAKNLLNFGKLKFECDCGRHDFWYRYIASIGGYGYGRQEDGYPKIRNKHLTGVACKHVLRVMDYIRSPMGIRYMQQQIEKARIKKPTKQTEKRQSQTEKQISDQLDEMSQSNPRKIVGDADVATRRMLRKAESIAKAHAKKMKDQTNEMQRKQVQERRNALVNTMSESELAAVEKYLASLRGNPNA